MNKQYILGIVAIAFLLGGCATKKQLEEVRAVAEQAQADAAAANSRADEAILAAGEANIKVDNMFRKAMLK